MIPRDGLRVRFHIVRDDQRVHLLLDHDGYARESPVTARDDLTRIEFSLENRTGGAHQTGLRVAGLPPGRYQIAVDGKRIAIIHGSNREQKVTLPVAATPTTYVVIARTGA